MKIKGFLLLIFLSNFCRGQSPLNFGGAQRMDHFDERYQQGYDEALFDYPVSQLKGNLSSCTIREIFPDTELKKGDLPETMAISYDFVYTYDENSDITLTEVNFTKKFYKKPPVVTEHVSRRSYAWDDKKNRVISYVNVLDDLIKLAVSDYDEHNRIKCQHWYGMKNGVVEYQLPLVVKYNYSKNGSCTLYGMLEKKYTNSDSMVKFTHDLDNLGRIVKRVIYNRDFRTTAANDPKNKEVFLYTYTKTGELGSMTYSKGDSGAISHFYVWKDPDAHGNPRIQQVCDVDKKVLYEIEWIYEYAAGK